MSEDARGKTTEAAAGAPPEAAGTPSGSISKATSPSSRSVQAAAPLAGFRKLMMRPSTQQPVQPPTSPDAVFGTTGDAAKGSGTRSSKAAAAKDATSGPRLDSAATSIRPSAPPPETPSQRPISRSTGDTSPLWSGRIRVHGEVGRGAMGYVMRGTDTKLRRELAIKVLPMPRDKIPQSQLARFVEEAQITAQLEHPNVVPVHDLGLDPDGRAYFSMKLVRGQSLEAILEKRLAGDAATLSEFGLRRLLDVFLQVCQAMEYAHARGVIHRDLKPANIMVGDFGEVLVMDWGVAKLKGRTESLLDDVTSVRAGNDALATQFGAVIGTPTYMSPEQAKGLNVDERTDLYALGVMLYEILCGQCPFDGTDPVLIIGRLLTETPRPPSEIQPRTPLALETLALRLLEKDPDRRTPTLRQIRSHVQDYIEGIGREYRNESLWANALWLLGALGLFAFLVWYLTGQSVATVVALTPSAVFNAIGWMLLVIAVGYPLWGASVGFRIGRTDHDRFRPPTEEEIFLSGYLAHRTLAAAIAPLFQLVFILELFGVAISQAARGGERPVEMVQAIVAQLRAEGAHALITILVFLFTYLLLLSTEVRFARRVDRYVHLVKRPKWEALWPLFLVVVLLATVVVENVLDWSLSNHGAATGGFFRDRILTRHLEVFEIVKTLVFQGTFLLGLVAATVLLAFPFAEVLASLRIAYQPADDASVSSRQQYFMRSMAVFRVARANWLYGGAMIASLTAVTILSTGARRPLVEQVLYILGPSLIGLVGYLLTRRYLLVHLASAPAVGRMLAEQLEVARFEQTEATAKALRAASWQKRLLQIAVPIGCVVGYLAWSGSGVHQHALRQLMLPVSAKGWLLILPYALLVPLLVVRDQAQLWLLRRRSG
jgi:tRNA A-37 threonylcarbamoyl transferase component Bud32